MASNVSTRTVLVIDDDEPFRTALHELLEGRGLVVRSVGDAFEARRALEDGQFDVIFTDIRMPGGGFSVLTQAREKRLRAPVIFITGSSSPEWKQRADAEGAFAYLVKPVGREQIVTVLRSALERGRGPAELVEHSTAAQVVREPMQALGR